jgi:hypothetical protein
MARDFDGTNDRLDMPSAFSPSVYSPFSVHMWINPDVLTGSQYLYNIHNSGNSSFHSHLWINTSYPTKVQFNIDFTTDPMYRGSSNDLSIGTWTAVGLGTTGSTTYTNTSIYFDGSEVSYGRNQNGSGSQTAVGDYSIGGRRYDDNRNFNGRIAHVAVWEVKLSDADFASLGSGADPRTIRPDQLLAYWPLLDSDGDVDWWGQYDLTADADGPTGYGSCPPSVTMVQGILLPYQVGEAAGGFESFWASNATKVAI